MPAITNIDDNYPEQLGLAGGVNPASGTSYDPTGSGLTATDVQAAIDEVVGSISGDFLTVVLGGQGTVQDHGTLGATETIDLALGNAHKGTLNQDCTITTTGWTNGKDCQIRVSLLQGGTGGWTPTLSGVTWIGGTPVWDTTAGTVTHVVLFSDNGGSTIYAGVLGGGGASAGQAPTLVQTGETYNVAANRQAPYTTPVVVDGVISIGANARFVEVN